MPSHSAKDLLTSDCDFDTNVNEYKEREEVHRAQAEDLLVLPSLS